MDVGLLRYVLVLEKLRYTLMQKINKASFGFKVILKYSVNTSVSRKNEVSNTLRRLDLVNTLVLKTEVSSKTSFFCLIGDFSLDLFFLKMKYSLKLKYMLPRHVNTMVLEYFIFQ
jgi:hypothetical protein